MKKANWVFSKLKERNPQTASSRSKTLPSRNLNTKSKKYPFPSDHRQFPSFWFMYILEVERQVRRICSIFFPTQIFLISLVHSLSLLTSIKQLKFMTSRTLRRRLHHGDVDGKKHEHLESSGMDSLNEPLLGKNDYEDKHPEGDTFEDIWDDERNKERLHWTLLFSNLIAQWAQWLGSFIGRLLPFPSASQSGPSKKFILPSLSSLQEARLKTLKQRLEVPFDGSCLEHQDALKQLWRLAYPDRELPALKSELWKDMGWQGPDPSTDFRGGGLISLENLIFFAKMYPEAFQNLLHKSDGERAEWEYPFAVASINLSFMLVQMLDLQSGKPASLAGVRFLDLLSEDEVAFDNLYCVAFQMMDAQWLAKRASYMQFNDVLKSTRTQLERELALEDISCVKDLPAYNLLKR